LATVLLHAYNPYEFKFDITELSRLDAKRQEMAWAILRMRVKGKEPQTLLQNPDDFKEVVELYGNLS